MPADFTGFLDLCRLRDHNAARLMEAYEWTILDIREGYLELDCHLPPQVLNLGGTLFGGFTPTYVDFVSIWTCMTTMPQVMQWLSTVNMRVDYLEPIAPPRFRMLGRLLNLRKRDYLIQTEFRAESGTLLSLGLTTLRRALDMPLS
jgi:acyl-coenzyme A thioesterase PaaI-like protein